MNTCNFCKQKFEPIDKWHLQQKYCSRKCQQKDYRRTHKDNYKRWSLNYYYRYHEKIKAKRRKGKPRVRSTIKDPKKRQVINSRKWKKKNPKKAKIHNLITHHPERYSLGEKCEFCDSINNLEHGHLDYEDDGYNYLTVCHACNMWMEKSPLFS